MAYPQDLMKEILFSEEDIRQRAKQLAEQINIDYEGKDLVLVCTLKGAVPFFSDLIKYINIPCQMEFIRASSYIGNRTTTIGNVKISANINFDVKDKEVLIVEDIVDTGLTINSLENFFKENKCLDFQVCALLDKPSRREYDVKLKYVGFKVDDVFIIGYGLDFNELYRNLPYIGIPNPKYIK